MKTFDDIRLLIKSIKTKKDILSKYFRYFKNEEIAFINSSTNIGEKFDDEIKEKDPNLDFYFATNYRPTKRNGF